MPRKKLQRFAELETFPNYFYEPEPMRGRWHEAYFKNTHPITLELGCGKGEYTLELARRFPQRNFIGVDKKGDRIWKGATAALAEALPNAAFARFYVEKISTYFAPGEINEIWITFPDPFVKPSKKNKRMTSPFFLTRYQEILCLGAPIHLKTDEQQLYEFTLDTIRAGQHTLLQHSPDIHADRLDEDDLLAIQTTYERRHIANDLSIKYVCFALNPSCTTFHDKVEVD